VEPGRVDEVAAILRPDVEGDRLVALGGGRVIDVAKALAAAEPPRHVAAIPTTLSAAEMTPLHRHATGVPDGTPHVRAAIVINDPALSASQPEPELAASALNSLGHAAEAPLTALANPVATLSAHEAARLITGAFASSAEPDRDALALGALLAGYAVSSTVYGLHHVLAQTAARVAGIGHGPANAILLPHTLVALRRRSEDRMAALDDAAGGDAVGAASAILARTGVTRLRDLGVERERLDALADAAASRRELALTPPPAARDEILALYEAAW
jgi:alcohol dehydrogenase class IV